MRPYLPEELLPELRRYMDHHVLPGSFLYACLCNDLFGACAAADDKNGVILVGIMAGIGRTVPIAIWGDTERVEKWLRVKK